MNDQTDATPDKDEGAEQDYSLDHAIVGGILAAHSEAVAPVAGVLLGLYAFGIGKAALMPAHPWLPNAMVAPTPVSAFLHAVAVVKAGVFSILKVAVYIFGVDFMRETGIGTPFIWIAGGSILLASAIAMNQDNLKARLAYSTVSQLSYVTLGAMLATSMGVMGGAMQPQGHVQVLLNMVEFGMDPQEAIDAARFRHLSGTRVAIENLDPEVAEQLQALGYIGN